MYSDEELEKEMEKIGVTPHQSEKSADKKTLPPTAQPAQHPQTPQTPQTERQRPPTTSGAQEQPEDVRFCFFYADALFHNHFVCRSICKGHWKSLETTIFPLDI